MKGTVFAEIGAIIPRDVFEVKGLSDTVIIREKLEALKEAWQAPLRF